MEWPGLESVFQYGIVEYGTLTHCVTRPALAQGFHVANGAVNPTKPCWLYVTKQDASRTWDYMGSRYVYSTNYWRYRIREGTVMVNSECRLAWASWHPDVCSDITLRVFLGEINVWSDWAKQMVFCNQVKPQVEQRGWLGGGSACLAAASWTLAFSCVHTWAHTSVPPGFPACQLSDKKLQLYVSAPAKTCSLPIVHMQCIVKLKFNFFHQDIFYKSLLISRTVFPEGAISFSIKNSCDTHSEPPLPKYY